MNTIVFHFHYYCCMNSVVPRIIYLHYNYLYKYQGPNCFVFFRLNFVCFENDVPHATLSIKCTKSSFLRNSVVRGPFL